MVQIAPVNPSAYLQNRADHTAQTFRLAIAGLVAGGQVQGATVVPGGVHPSFGNRLNVAGTAGMNVTVDTGLVYMPDSTAWGGVFVGYNNGSYTVPIAVASATQWRSDYICARQHDAAQGDADNNWDIVAVTGTFASSSPGALPALPNRAVPLGIVRVVPNMTVTNGAGTVVDARTYMHVSSPIITTSSSRPPLTAQEGTMWYETDLKALGIVANGAYRYIYMIPGAPTQTDTWHALPTLATGFNLNAGLPVSGYRLAPYDPTIMEIMGSVFVNNSVRADGTTMFTMPSGWRPSADYQRIVMATNSAWTTPRTDGQAAYLQFSSTGAVTVNGLPPSSGSVYWNGHIRIT